MSQSVGNVFRDPRKNCCSILQPKQRVEKYSLYILFELKFSGKFLKKSMQQVLALRQSRMF